MGRIWGRIKTVPLLRATLVWFIAAIVTCFVALPLPFVAPILDMVLFFSMPLIGAAIWLAGLVRTTTTKGIALRKHLIALIAMPLAAAIVFVLAAPLARLGERWILSAYLATQENKFMATVARAMDDPTPVPHIDDATHDWTIYLKGAAWDEAPGQRRIVAFSLPRRSSDGTSNIVWDGSGAVIGGEPVEHWRGGYEPAASVNLVFSRVIRRCWPLYGDFYLCEFRY